MFHLTLFKTLLILMQAITGTKARYIRHIFRKTTARIQNKYLEVNCV